MAFVHLHNHSPYSLLDGAAKIERMIAKAVELDMPALAVTDHGVMYGVITLYQKLEKLKKETGQEIKPILGCEVYVAPRSRFDKEAHKDAEAYHLVLLAENMTGYRNLCRLVSAGFTEGFYYKPRVDLALLEECHEGLIALSACIAGQIPQSLLDGDFAAAKELTLRYKDIFGPDNFFLEIQNHMMEEELKVNPLLAQIGRELNIPLVATNDIHYIEKSDANMHDILLCIQTGKIRSEENRMRFPCPEFYFKTEAEMRLLFQEWPEAIDNTVRIAERCNLQFEFGQLFLPDYDVPENYDLYSYLEFLCWQGLQKRYGEPSEELKERLRFELDIIQKTGFPGYFLITWDLINFARQNNIPVGPGRGSAAGSLVAYTLGITNIDPIRYHLLFERFLNPERVSPPDIDSDFCYERRGEVIEYLVQKYGADKVGQIITFGTMLAKGAVRDVGRVLNIPYAEVDKVAKLIPFGSSLTEALQSAPDLRELYQNNPEAREMLDIAQAIEGMPRHSSTHAAGVVIAQEQIVNYMPVQKTAEGFLTTQFEKEQVEECGLLKMDILGLRTLTVINDAVNNIAISRKEKIDIDNIPLTDPKTYEMLGQGDSIGVFQLESDGMRAIMKNLHPERLEDIIALVALYRPGPLEGGMVDDFIQRKHGKKRITYMHPLLEPILKETYGVILYQEQVMQIASALAGFSLGQADMLRRAMGKKKPEIIAKERSHFTEGCLANGINGKLAGEIFDLMEKFAGYGFNKSHSAAYGLVAYQTAWLKANYPAEFMAAMLTSVMDHTEKVPDYIEAARRQGIEVLPPDINQSRLKFAVIEGKIRFGLAAVKNVGRDAAQKLIEERQNGLYTSLEDICRRVPTNRKTLENLIKCGAMDSLKQRRSQMLAVVDTALDIGRRLSQKQESAQLSLFDFGIAEVETLKVEMPNLPEYPKGQLLAMEKETIGFFISGHPLDTYTEVFRKKTTHGIDELARLTKGTKVKVGGMIGGVRRTVTKRGELMATFMLENAYGAVRCLAFPASFANYPEVAEEGKILIIEGKLQFNEDQPEIILEKTICPMKLYLRLPSSQDSSMRDRVQRILSQAPGDVGISVYYDDLQNYFAFPGLAGVAPEQQMIENITSFIGKDNIVLR